MRTRFVNGHVWTTYAATADPARGTWQVTDAALIEGDRITAVGAAAHGTEVDRVVDLAGGLLLPGFADGHVHPLFGGLQALHAPVQEAADVDDVARVVAEWAVAHPDDAWIIGYGYDPSMAPGGVFEARWLDVASPDRPVALWASDFHTMWVNTAALARAGITDRTPDPLDGVIERYADRTPLGTLREWGAWGPVAALLPDTAPVRVDAVARATAVLAAAGITWVQDAWVEAETADAWITAAAADRLKVRADLAWRFDPAIPAAANVAAAVDLRARLDAAGTGERLTARTVKFFADGVIEGGTGALLEPYCDCAAMHGADRGLPVWETGALAEAVTAAMRAGFAPHIHAIGDAAVRMALDAIEAARHGPPPTPGAARPVIAHTQLVDDVDIPRFAALGVVANFEPLWACLDASQTELTAPRLGPERAARQYRIATLLRSGAAVSFGSDWPVSSYDPRAGIRTAVTRIHAGQPAWTPAERIGLGTAVAAYTSGTAYQAGTETVRGQISPGFDADLVWLTDPHGVGGSGGVLGPGVPEASEEYALLGEVRGTWCAGERTHHG